MRETSVRVTSVVTCDRCGVRGEAGATHTMRDSHVPILAMREATLKEANEGFTADRFGHGSPLLDLCGPCLRLVQTALTPIKNEEDDQ